MNDLDSKSDAACWTFLGQVGCLFRLGGFSFAVDPYLSDSVAEKYGAQLQRRTAVPISPSAIGELDFIFLTHAHDDHTDPATLRPLCAASPGALVYCPYESRPAVEACGVEPGRIRAASEAWQTLGLDLAVKAVPAAHVQLERNAAGDLRYCGYLFRTPRHLVYHAGDTIPHPDIVAAVREEGGVDLAFLPCNERNYYRDRAGIVGNMTPREMFAFADELRVRRIVPTHWDLFGPNSTDPREIELVHREVAPQLEMLIPQSGKTYYF